MPVGTEHAYAMFEVPTGWLGDVFGPRKTLIRIVLWWSFFTMLTGLAGLAIGGITFVTFSVLVGIQFMFGIGEAGAYPNITRALHNWFPLKDRGITQGSVWFFSRLMGGLTPLIWMLLVVWGQLPWRMAFGLFGIFGLLWCIAFALWFRNRPEEHPAVNQAELDLIGSGKSAHETEKAHAGVPWGKLLTSRTLWGLCVMYFCMSYGWYFNLYYLPVYLEDRYGVKHDELVGTLFKGGPLILGALGCLLGGWLTERFIRRTGNRVWGRRIFGMTGHAICVPCYLYCIIATDKYSFAFAISLAGFCNDLAMGSAWAACQDIGKRYSAIVAGCMNTVGNLGGAASAKVIGLILGLSMTMYAGANNVNLPELKAKSDEAKKMFVRAEQGKIELTAEQKQELDADVARMKEMQISGERSGFNYTFLSFAVLYAIAAFLWLGINATRPVVPEEPV